MKQLYTAQGEALTGTPWQVYPRPQLRRESYVNLNGEYEFAVRAEAALPQTYDRKILVPFCPESALSGIGQHFEDGRYLFYRRFFSLPQGFQKARVLLHIGAADQELTCYVNQKEVGAHLGGYEAMTFDITEALQTENELVFRCRDDLRSPVQPYGKQTLKRGGMWYTPVSGIWQTVWLESVPENYVNRLKLQVDLTCATVTVEPALDGRVTCQGRTYPLEKGRAVITPVSPKCWTPDAPHLYDFVLEAGQDRVESYFALRTLETRVLDGVPRLCLNGKPFFFHGLLDQGYWPDGLFTPPDPGCYAEDISRMKDLGFNTLRKHIKVEPEEFYYQCDKLGMIVFQDMVNNGDYKFLRDTAFPTFGRQKRSDRKLHRDAATRQAFVDGMEATVRQLYNHPSICLWTVFNEGWGQFDSTPLYERLRQLDDSRFVDTTSGWFRGSRTDVESLHVYFRGWGLLKKTFEKPLVLSEFGGYVYAVEGHIFNPDKAYGYRTCKSREVFMADLEKLYRQRILPAAKVGLCAAIYTQVSDVEDEINGLITYDRRVCKADAAIMQAIARDLQAALP